VSDINNAFNNNAFQEIINPIKNEMNYMGMYVTM